MIPNSWYSHSRKLHLSWRWHNLRGCHPLFVALLSTIWQLFVFNQEQHYNKIDKRCLDGLIETDGHRMHLARGKGRSWNQGANLGFHRLLLVILSRHSELRAFTILCCMQKTLSFQHLLPLSLIPLLPFPLPKNIIS